MTVKTAVAKVRQRDGMERRIWALQLVLALGALLFLASCSAATSNRLDAGRPAHHTDDGFRNLHIETPDKSFFSFLKMRYFCDVEWADHAAEASQVPARDLDLEVVLTPGADLQVSWLGHSTFLIQRAGVNILTDPIFADRASPFSFAGPKRYTRHVVDYDKLPKIDYVFISHNHYDHLDIDTVRHLGNTPLYFVPLGLKNWFMDAGIDASRIREMDWWDQVEAPGIKVQAMPSQHWSARGLLDRHETLWASWHFQINDRSFWFAGDTGYNDVQFKEIGEKTGGIDYAFIPIGGYLPRSFMGDYHVNPEEAVKIHRDVNASVSFGMHWGTFPLTAEGPGAPVIELEKQLKIQALPAEKFQTLELGETVRYPG